MVTSLAGSGAASFADGFGSNARFNYPQAVAVDASGNVFVADRSNHRIRKVTAGGGTRFDSVNLRACSRCVQACQSAGVSGLSVVSSFPSCVPFLLRLFSLSALMCSTESNVCAVVTVTFS